LNTDSVLEYQQLTQSSENIEATRQKVEQDQQRKLQHQHDIDQGIVKPMPDDLQKRINLLGNQRKGK
jgi:hypothetical protein